MLEMTVGPAPESAGCGTVAVVGLSEPLMALGVGMALGDAEIPVVDAVADVAPGVGRAVVVSDPARLSVGEVVDLTGLGVGVLVLAHRVDHDHVVALVRAGARGYLDASAGPIELVDGIRAVAAGRLALTASAQDAILRGGEPRSDVPELSPREQQILLLIADGQTTRQIAQSLYVAEATVKTHVQRLGQKLGERRRGGMLLRASRLGLL